VEGAAPAVAAAPTVANGTSRAQESATRSHHAELRIIASLLRDRNRALLAQRRRPIRAAATLSCQAYTSMAVESGLTASAHRSRPQLELTVSVDT